MHTMPETRRFPAPWSIEETIPCFIVRDSNGQAIAYVYCEDEPQRQLSTKRLSRDEAKTLPSCQPCRGRY